jgi:hypothetical protein
MKFSRVILLLNFCLVLYTHSPAQVARNGKQDYSKFLIESNKPYVYLEVDHIGPRKPLRNDEPNTGIWMYLKNNCKLPIVVLVIGNPVAKSKDAITLADEIVPDPQVPTQGKDEDARGGGVFAQQGLRDMMDIFRFPNMTEEEIKSAEEKTRASTNPIERPRGYGSKSGFDSFVLTLIAPGDHLYFSVPANHVSKSWHFEIPFRLALPNNSRIRPPYSYVAFYQDDLDRAEGKTATPTTR